MNTKSTVKVTTSKTSKTSKVSKPKAKRGYLASVNGKTYTNVVNGGEVGARGRRPFSDREIASDVRRVSIELGYTDNKGNHLVYRTNAKGVKSPVNMSAKEYTNHGIFSGILIAKRFGSYSEFRDEVTHAPRGRTNPTKRMLLKELNRVVRVLQIDEDFEFDINEFSRVSKFTWQRMVSAFGSWEGVRLAAMENNWDSRIN